MRFCNVHKSRREREREREHDKKRVLVMLSLCSTLSYYASSFRAHAESFRRNSLAFLWFFVSMYFTNPKCLTKTTVDKKKKFSSSSSKISKRGVNVKCRNEKQQQRRMWVVLNRRVLRASTREEDVRKRVKALIVAYGRRTWTREV